MQGRVWLLRWGGAGKLKKTHFQDLCAQKLLRLRKRRNKNIKTDFLYGTGMLRLLKAEGKQEYWEVTLQHCSPYSKSKVNAAHHQKNLKFVEHWRQQYNNTQNSSAADRQTQVPRLRVPQESCAHFKGYLLFIVLYTVLHINTGIQSTRLTHRRKKKSNTLSRDKVITRLRDNPDVETTR